MADTSALKGMSSPGNPFLTGISVAEGRAAAVPATPADAAQPGSPQSGASGSPANGWSPAGTLANGWARLLLRRINPAAVLAAWQLSTAAGIFRVVRLPSVVLAVIGKTTDGLLGLAEKRA
jgi:sulfonate transport system permease protein